MSELGPRQFGIGPSADTPKGAGGETPKPVDLRINPHVPHGFLSPGAESLLHHPRMDLYHRGLISDPDA